VCINSEYLPYHVLYIQLSIAIPTSIIQLFLTRYDWHENIDYETSESCKNMTRKTKKHCQDDEFDIHLALTANSIPTHLGQTLPVWGSTVLLGVRGLGFFHVTLQILENSTAGN